MQAAKEYLVNVADDEFETNQGTGKDFCIIPESEDRIGESTVPTLTAGNDEDEIVRSSTGESRIDNVLRLTGGEDIENQEPLPIALFWDVENAHVPKKKVPVPNVVTKLLECFTIGRPYVRFFAVLDTNLEKSYADSLDESGVRVVHIKSGRKNEADNKIIELMTDFVSPRSGRCEVVLITDDGDFSRHIADMRKKYGTRYTAVHTKFVSSKLMSVCTEALSINEIIDCESSKEQCLLGEPTVVSITLVEAAEAETLKKMTGITNGYGGKLFQLSRLKYEAKFKDGTMCIQSAQELQDEICEWQAKVEVLVPMSIKDFLKLEGQEREEEEPIPKRPRMDTNPNP